MFVPTHFLLLSLSLLLHTQLAVSVTPSPTSLSTRRSSKRKHADGATEEDDRMKEIDETLASHKIPSELATIVGGYEGLSTPRLASQVFDKSPMTLKSEPAKCGLMFYYYTSTINVPQHSSIELGTLDDLTNGVGDSLVLSLNFKVSLPTKNCRLSEAEISMLGLEIRNEKTKKTDRCLNVVLSQDSKGNTKFQVPLLTSIATLDWKYYLVLPRLSNCSPEASFIVDTTYRYMDISQKINSNDLPNSISFGQLPEQFEKSEKAQVPTLPRIPYQEEDLVQFADARVNVPGVAKGKSSMSKFEGRFETQRYTSGSMIHLGSMNGITKEKHNRGDIVVTARVQVFDISYAKDDKSVEVEALSDVRIRAYEDVEEEKEKGTRLLDEDWTIQTFNGLSLKASPVVLQKGRGYRRSVKPTYEPTGGVVLTKTLSSHTVNAQYWLLLPPLPHGFEYRVTIALSYFCYPDKPIKSSEWVGKDYEKED